MTLKHFDLGLLRIAPENPRTHRPDESIQTMAASIVAVGLLHSLVGYEENGTVQLTAGGTRMDAIKAALTDGRLKPNDPRVTDIPVTIKPKAIAIDTGLTSNLVQSMMSAADQFKAFHRLHHDEKVDVAEIAARYFTDEAQVNRILKLAELPDPIFAAFDAGKLRLDQAKAYAGCADSERQERVFEGLGLAAHPQTIRQSLRAESYLASDDKVTFVGLDSYQERGGRITDDLFDDKRILVDGDLIDTLFEERIETIKAELSDAGWGEVELFDGDYFWDRKAQHAVLRSAWKPTKRDAQAHEKATGELETVFENHGENNWQWSDRVTKRVAKINARIEKIEARANVYSDKQKLGGLALLHYVHGNVEIHYLSAKTKKAEIKDGNGPAKADQPFSNAFVEQVTRTSGQALMAHLCHNPGRLNRVIAIMALNGALDGVDRSGATVRKEKFGHDIEMPELEDRKPMRGGDMTQAELVEYLLGLSDDQLDAEMAYALLPRYEIGWANGAAVESFRAIAKAADFNLADAWTFGEEELSSLNGKQLLRVVSSLGRDADALSKSKKREKVIVTARYAQEQRWTPEFIRTHEPIDRQTTKALTIREDDSDMAEEITAAAEQLAQEQAEQAKTASPEADAS